jgi:hypothetical protein
VYGTGWEAEEELASCWRGPVTSRGAWTDAIAHAQALVHPWPTKSAHPIDAAGRPVLRATAGRPHLVRSAESVLSGVSLSVPMSNIPVLSAELVRRVLFILGRGVSI